MNDASHQALAEAFRTSVKRSIQIGDTLHLLIGADTQEIDVIAEKKIKAALATGQTVIENGVSTWIGTSEVLNQNKSGSAAYTWDKSGNKIKIEKFLVTKTADGAVSRKSLGFAWRNFN